MAKRITDEIAAIAVASGYDGPAPKNKVEALNALALALGYDGAYQKRTADAINAVGTVAGGGGGVNLGPLGIAASASGTPTVGSMSAEGECIAEVRIGNQLVTTGIDTAINTLHFAAGLTLSTLPVPNSEVVCTAYVVTIDSNGRYATVEEWDGTITRREVTADGNQAWVWDFVMPELAEGEALELFLHLSNSST